MSFLFLSAAVFSICPSGLQQGGQIQGFASKREGWMTSNDGDSRLLSESLVPRFLALVWLVVPLRFCVLTPLVSVFFFFYPPRPGSITQCRGTPTTSATRG